MANQASKKNAKKASQIKIVYGATFIGSLTGFFLMRYVLDGKLPVNLSTLLVNILILVSWFWVHEAALIGNHSETAFDVYWICIGSLLLGGIWSNGIWLVGIIPIFVAIRGCSIAFSFLRGTEARAEAKEEEKKPNKTKIRSKKLE